MKLRFLLALLLGALLLLLSPQVDTPRTLSFPQYATVQAQPKVAPQDPGAEYRLLLRMAAQEPHLALAQLDDLAFSGDQNAESARQLAQSIRAAELEGLSAYTLTAVGQTLAGFGEWHLSVEALRNAVELDPDYAEAWAFLGEALQHIGEDGAEALAMARRIDPLSVAANLFQALYWQRHGDFKEASRYLRIAAQIEPQNASIYLQLGHNTVLAGDIPAARDHYEHAIALAPDSPEMWKALAAYSLDNDIFTEDVGLPAALRALLLSPQDPGALVLMARAVFLVNGDGTHAETLFERALALAPDHPAAHLYYGLHLLANGYALPAKEHLDAVLRAAPGSPEATLARQVLVEHFR